MLDRKEKIKSDVKELDDNTSYTVERLIEVLSKYEPKANIMFEDFNFKSSVKEPVLDVIFQEEEYPTYNNIKRVHRVILVNKNLNFDKHK